MTLSGAFKVARGYFMFGSKMTGKARGRLSCASVLARSVKHILSLYCISRRMLRLLGVACHVF